jgi:hypothetical protein
MLPAKNKTLAARFLTLETAKPIQLKLDDAKWLTLGSHGPVLHAQTSKYG